MIRRILSVAVFAFCMATPAHAQMSGGRAGPPSAAATPSRDPAPANNPAIIAGNAAYERRDFATAAVQFASACDAGNAAACGALGDMYLKGEGVSASGARAAGPLAKACDAGSAASCGKLGVLYDSGNGIAPNKARAFTLFNGACSRSDMASCYNLGRLYDRGQGVALNAAQAAALYQRACTAGIADGCSSIGTMYVRGAHFTKNETQALAFFKLACQKGGQTGCQLYTSLVDDRKKNTELAVAQESSRKQTLAAKNGGEGLRSCIKDDFVTTTYSKPSECRSLGGGVCDNPLESYTTSTRSSSFQLTNICGFLVEVTYLKHNGDTSSLVLKSGQRTFESDFKGLFGENTFQKILTVTREPVRQQKFMKERETGIAEANKLHAQCLAGSDLACELFMKSKHKF